MLVVSGASIFFSRTGPPNSKVGPVAAVVVASSMAAFRSEGDKSRGGDWDLRVV
jgi:hypothetical protein